MSEESPVLFDVTDGVGWITFNRPDRLNAINVDMVNRLQECLELTTTDPAIRVLVITGAGRGFCSGADLAQLFSSTGVGTPSSHAVPQHSGIQKFTAGLLYLDKPVIAAVNGPAVGAGFELALACDIRVMAESGYFMEAAMRHGLIPGDGSVLLLPRIVGSGRAIDILLNGHRVRPDDALAFGLATSVFADTKFREEVNAMANAIAQLPADATALLKQSLRLSAPGPEIGSVFSFLRLGVTHGKAMRMSEGKLSAR